MSRNIYDVAPGRIKATNITTKTTTLVKTGEGRCMGITINKVGSTDTLTVYDGVDANGLLKGTITIIATDVDRRFVFDFATGLTIVSGGGTAGDYTVFWE